MARPKTYDEALRRRLLKAAEEFLAAGGAASLSLRSLAAAAGTSTSAVYSLFGGKSALLNAIYAEAFSRLYRHLAVVPATEDPAADLVRIGLAYRDSALENPHLYRIMFGQAPAGLEPGEPERVPGREALGVLAETVQRGVRAGIFPEGSARQLTLAAWALVHGLVSLELDGKLPPGASAPRDYEQIAQDYEQILRDTVQGWRTFGQDRS
jgi:AcrR family transcriptional regulator